MEILEVRIDNLTTEETLEKVEDFLSDGQQHYIITSNPEFLVRAHQEPKFKQILNQADLAVPDGIGLIFASWFLGQPLKQRITGVDLMEKICERASQKKWPVFLFGGKKNVSQKTAEKLEQKYSQLKINSLASEILNAPEINTQEPAVLFVALGAGKQEKWIVQNLKAMPSVKLAMAVGGAFDFISGRVKRAPKIFRLLGLEWFWRLTVQPWRLKRIFRAVIVFPWLVLKSKR